MKVDIRNPRLKALLDPSQKLTRVATGFEFTEGPIWNPDEQNLVFSDILGNSIFSWHENTGVTTLCRNSFMANGNAYDRQGRIITCEHATSRLTRIDFTNNGEREVLASHYMGKELNSPNDVVCRSEGSLYFTDPNSGRSAGYGIPRAQELDFQGVYRLDPNALDLTLLVEDFSKPNGLCFSTDEHKIFIDDTDQGHIRVFDVNDDGTLTNGRIWAELDGVGVGVADGMNIDREDNLYCTGPGGIHVFDSEANYLAIIPIPEQATNLAWGDDDLCSLYITATTSIYRLRTNTAGAR